MIKAIIVRCLNILIENYSTSIFRQLFLFDKITTTKQASIGGNASRRKAFDICHQPFLLIIFLCMLYHQISSEKDYLFPLLANKPPFPVIKKFGLTKVTWNWNKTDKILISPSPFFQSKVIQFSCKLSWKLFTNETLSCLPQNNLNPLHLSHKNCHC